MNILKIIGSTIYQSVWVAKKSTITGAALVAADWIVNSLQTAPLPTWLHMVVGGIALALVAYQKKQPVLPASNAIEAPRSGPTLGGAAAIALLFMAGTGCGAVQKVDNSLKGDAFSVTSGGQTVSGKVSADGSFCFDVAEPIQIGPATCSHICIGPTTQICTAPAIAGSATSTLTVKSGP